MLYFQYKEDGTDTCFYCQEGEIVCVCVGGALFNRGRQDIIYWVMLCTFVKKGIFFSFGGLS